MPGCLKSGWWRRFTNSNHNNSHMKTTAWIFVMIASTSSALFKQANPFKTMRNIKTSPWPPSIRHTPWTARGLLIATSVVLTACATPYAGVSVPVGPISLGVGASSGGVSVGAGTGVGPVGVGVGVNQRGQVTGSTGVGASTRLGNSNARVGAGVGTSTTLYDPQNHQVVRDAPNSVPPHSGTVSPVINGSGNAPAQPNTRDATVWHDADGNVIPACKIKGLC